MGQKWVKIHLSPVSFQHDSSQIFGVCGHTSQHSLLEVHILGQAIYSRFVFAGILPAHQGSHSFVATQRSQQYSDLIEALRLMRKVTLETPLEEIHLKMMLLETGSLIFDECRMVSRDTVA